MQGATWRDKGATGHDKDNGKRIGSLSNTVCPCRSLQKIDFRVYLVYFERVHFLTKLVCAVFYRAAGGAQYSAACSAVPIKLFWASLGTAVSLTHQVGIHLYLCDRCVFHTSNELKNSHASHCKFICDGKSLVLPKTCAPSCLEKMLYCEIYSDSERRASTLLAFSSKPIRIQPELLLHQDMRSNIIAGQDNYLDSNTC